MGKFTILCLLVPSSYLTQARSCGKCLKKQGDKCQSLHTKTCWPTAPSLPVWLSSVGCPRHLCMKAVAIKVDCNLLNPHSAHIPQNQCQHSQLRKESPNSWWIMWSSGFRKSSSTQRDTQGTHTASSKSGVHNMGGSTSLGAKWACYEVT